MLLAKLGIRRKLALLLAIPLIAVVLVLVPFTAERVAQAGSASTTARTAEIARRVGSLIQTLQQERLLALGYLSAPTLDRSALGALTQTAADDAARLCAAVAISRAIRSWASRRNAVYDTAAVRASDTSTGVLAVSGRVIPRIICRMRWPANPFSTVSISAACCGVTRSR
jgi:hypothetical protein